MVMGRQPDVLALKGEVQENGKTEEAMQNILDFSDKAQKKLFKEVGGFNRRWSISLELKKQQENSAQEMGVE